MRSHTSRVAAGPVTLVLFALLALQLSWTPSTAQDSHTALQVSEPTTLHTVQGCGLYVVQPQERAQNIAEHFGVPLSALLKLNPGVAVEVDLSLGEEVTIPCSSSGAQSTAAKLEAEEYQGVRAQPPAGDVSGNRRLLAPLRRVLQAGPAPAPSVLANSTTPDQAAAPAAGVPAVPANLDASWAKASLDLELVGADAVPFSPTRQTSLAVALNNLLMGYRHYVQIIKFQETVPIVVPAPPTVAGRAPAPAPGSPVSSSSTNGTAGRRRRLLQDTQPSVAVTLTLVMQRNDSQAFLADVAALVQNGTLAQALASSDAKMSVAATVINLVLSSSPTSTTSYPPPPPPLVSTPPSSPTASSQGGIIAAAAVVAVVLLAGIGLAVFCVFRRNRARRPFMDKDDQRAMLSGQVFYNNGFNGGVGQPDMIRNPLTVGINATAPGSTISEDTAYERRIAGMGSMQSADMAGLAANGSSADLTEGGKGSSPADWENTPGRQLSGMLQRNDSSGSARLPLNLNSTDARMIRYSSANLWKVNRNELHFQKVIGEGSFGTVYSGLWHETIVAIKVLTIAAYQTDSKANEAQKQQLLVALEKEASMMSAMRHPNVVMYLGLCPEPPCVVTEYCSRGSLCDVLKRAREEAARRPGGPSPLDWHRRLVMALDAAKGMMYLHSAQPPIIHRDLKSPNLLVDKFWRVKVCDFNLSRVMEETGGPALVSSVAQATNPRWLAPEILTGASASFGSDIYSFSLIMWELLTWEVPFAESGPWQIVAQVTEGVRPPIPEPADVRGGSFQWHDDYVRLMQRCWAPEPAERPGFGPIITALRQLLESETLRLRAVASERRNLAEVAGDSGEYSPGASSAEAAAIVESPELEAAAQEAEQDGQGRGPAML